MKRAVLAFGGFLFFFLFCGAAALSVLRTARLGLQEELSRFLGVPVRIEQVALGPRRLTLQGVTVQEPSSAAAAALWIERLEMEGQMFSLRRFWLLLNRRPLLPAGPLTLTGVTFSVAGFPLEAQGKVRLTSVPGSYAVIEGRLSLEHPFLRGEVDLSGRLLEPVTEGWVEGAFIPRRHFVGEWKIGEDSIQLIRMEMEQGWLCSGRLSLSRQGEMELEGPETRIQLKLAAWDSQAAQATLWVYREGLDPKEISVRWNLKWPRLIFSAAVSGAAADLKGWMGLQPPYPLDLTLTVRQIPLAEAAEWVPPASEWPRLKGSLKVEVHLAGSAQAPDFEGDFSARQVQFNDLWLDTVAVRFEGKGSHLWVDGTIHSRPESVLLAGGWVDLRRFGRPDFFNTVRLDSMGRGGAQVDGQRVLSQASSGVFVQRAIGAERMKVGLAYKIDTGVPQEPLERRGLEVEYPIGTEHAVRVRMEKEEQFFGVEHRKKF